jgi:hypothetical protein
MMYWWDYGASPPWYGMFLGPLMMIIFLVVAALIIVWVVRASGAGRQSAVRSIATNTRSASSCCPAHDESPFKKLTEAPFGNDMRDLLHPKAH